MKSLWASAPFILGLSVLSVGCSKPSVPQKAEVKGTASARPAPSLPQITVTPAVQAKAETPKPGPKATRKAHTDQFGQGRASITVKGHPGGENHSFWTEELDVDGSGQVSQVDEAWDNHHKVLYVSKSRAFSCRNGQNADGSTLMAVYAKGNSLGKPTGSGWWVAELDDGECSVPVGGIYGCRFDPDGKNTDCGAATVESDRDEVDITPLPGADSNPSSSGSAPAQAPAAPDSSGPK